VKIAFLFFLLITHLCGAPASWAARHTTVCLDTPNMDMVKVVNYIWYFLNVSVDHVTTIIWCNFMMKFSNHYFVSKQF